MSEAEGRYEDELPRGPWTDRVNLSTESGGFAYRPRQVLTTGDQEALEVARRLFPESEPPVRIGREFGIFSQLLEVPDPIRLVHELRIRGFVAQPNHVFFTHSSPCCCPPHPSTMWSCGRCDPATAVVPLYGSALSGSPVYASPVYASPVYASPVYASPVYASPVYASDYRDSGIRKSSARPATPTADLVLLEGETFAAASQPVIAILDTGFAATAFRPAALPTTNPVFGFDVDDPDEDGDGLLDPAAGHGTFIAGIIQQLAPGCTIVVDRVLSTFGDGSELDVAAGIAEIVGLDPPVNLLNLSFGGYTMDHPEVLASAIRDAQAAGVVVVASAGNDAVCRPTYPAALPGVIGVGALGPSGPAPFTNYGPWVRACAPGVDLISTFFNGFNGIQPAPPGDPDPDSFSGWAAWSGTSFSGPIVVGALAREIRNGLAPEKAVERVVDAPWLLRIPNLGTIVNVL